MTLPKNALIIAAAAAALALAVPALSLHAESPAKRLPTPATTESQIVLSLKTAPSLQTAPSLPTAPSLQTAIFAGGCFWGIQGVFEHIKGVTQAVSGYTGGTPANPSYEQVSTGETGHAEAVRVTFDPTQVSYAKLLQIFFSVALDPTQVDRQGPDWGTQYRSALFPTSPAQDQAAHAYLTQLEATHSFPHPIATRIYPAKPFYPAETYHQDYLERFPTNGYIAANDIPKVQALQRLFPESWQTAPVLVGKLSAAKS